MLSHVSNNPALSAKIAEMRLKLAPLVRITTGAVHPCFPTTLLHYWLLTSAELDELANFYHQRTPSEWTNQYPKMMGWKLNLSLEEKRRKWGKFIGLKGCETPVQIKSEEEIWEEARRQRMAAEDDMMRRKREWYY
jgi:hypothetical protein